MTKPYRRRRPLWLRLATLGAVGLALVFFFLWQQNGLQVETVEVVDPNLPKAFDGLRIVHLSDLHGKEFGPSNTNLLAEIESLDPDLIAITGDAIDRAEQLETLGSLAQGLVKIAPTYYVTGNHEWAVGHVRELKDLLTTYGVTVLSNQYVLWEKDGQTLAVAGIDDPNGPADQKTGPELRGEIDADYTLLLAHRDTVETYSDWGYDLILCGHGHGGVIRIPIVDMGLLATDRTLFPDYSGGLYPLSQKGFCFVSRGLGSNTTPIHAFRLFNRPHLPLILLRSGD